MKKIICQTYESIIKSEGKTLTVCIAQVATIPGNGNHNIAKMIDFMDQVKARGADVICFHELTICDYANIEEWGEPIPGKTTDRIREKAKEIGVGVIFGLPEIDNDKLYNSAVIIDRKGELVGKYRKTHLSFDTGSGNMKIPREVDVFTPGKELPVFDTWLGKIGLMICKDGLFPEVPRILSIKGAEIIFWLNNRGGLFQANQESIARLNKVVLCSSNRARTEKVWEEGGGSTIVFFEKNSGVLRAGTSETLLVGTIDLTAVRKGRKNWFENWLNRQPEIYGALVSEEKDTAGK